MRNYAPLARGGYDLGKAFAMAPQMESQGAGNAMANAIRDALNQARIGKVNSETDLNQQRLAGVDSGRQMFMQGATGLAQPQLNELAQAMTQGFPQVPAEGPPTPDGQFPTMTDRPDWASQPVMDQFNQAQMALGANMAGTGKTHGEQLVAAMQGAANLGRQNQMIAGTLDPNRVAPAMAATAGKPIVDVTGSGIAFNPYGDVNHLNTAPFEQANQSKAQSRIDAVINRVRATGNSLPAEAKLLEYYMRKGEPYETAKELARSRKNVPLRQLAMEAYQSALQNILMMEPPEGMSEEEFQTYANQQAEQNATATVEFLNSNRKLFEGERDAAPDPLGLFK